MLQQAAQCEAHKLSPKSGVSRTGSSSSLPKAQHTSAAPSCESAPTTQLNIREDADDTVVQTKLVGGIERLSAQTLQG
jgi:hypothetical protein